MPVEVWKEVPGYEGKYEVSNHGNVRAMPKCNWKTKYCWPQREMKLHVHNNGYAVVWLRKPGKHQKFFVHRLVAMAFFEPVEGSEFVNHKNKDRLNNHVDNLEYCTHKENCDHRDNYQPNDEPF